MDGVKANIIREDTDQKVLEVYTHAKKMRVPISEINSKKHLKEILKGNNLEVSPKIFFKIWFLVENTQKLEAMPLDDVKKMINKKLQSGDTIFSKTDGVKH